MGINISASKLTVRKVSVWEINPEQYFKFRDELVRATVALFNTLVRATVVLFSTLVRTTLGK